jgi:hypothetical protein
MSNTPEVKPTTPAVTPEVVPVVAAATDHTAKPTVPVVSEPAKKA